MKTMKTRTRGVNKALPVHLINLLSVVASLRGPMMVIVLSGAGWIAHAAEGAHAEGLYLEKYRPQFHFTPKQSWVGDPNGLIYYKGEYHRRQPRPESHLVCPGEEMGDGAVP
ncbi:MAG: hypothetical protein NTW21_26810 [Verrucomicrobia bacterium]|nr:hypothetical protein [Verrucomicrobiota bacterium]